MTYVQYINCSKWKKIIGISLWIGASIGIGYLLNMTIPIWGTELPAFTACNESHDPFKMSFGYTCSPDYVKEGTLIGIVIFLNVLNYFMIWRTLNNHYQWLEIRCGIKPTDKITGTSTRSEA